MSIFVNKFISSSFVVLLLRLWLGIVFIAHGSQKLLGWFGGRGFSGTLDAWEQNIGIPNFLGVIAIAAEFLGGIGLMLGFLTRLAALGIMGVMAVAISMQTGFFNPKGIEFQATLFLIAFIILLYGPGRFSVDRQIYNKGQHFNEI